MGCKCARLPVAQSAIHPNRQDLAQSEFSPIANTPANMRPQATPAQAEPDEGGINGLLVDVPSPCVTKTPSLLQVRPLPRKISIVKSRNAGVVEVSVQDVAKDLSSRHSVSVEQAIEALRCSNFDPDDAASLLGLRDPGIGEGEALVRRMLPIGSRPLGHPGNSGLKALQRPEALLSKAVIDQSNSVPTQVEASQTFLQLATGVKRGTTGSLAPRQTQWNNAFMNPLVVDPVVTAEDDNQRAYAAKQPQDVEARSPPQELDGKTHLRNTIATLEMTPHSRRLDYFKNKCEVKSNISDLYSLGGAASPLNIAAIDEEKSAEMIVLESSVIGQYFMPPWQEDDPDVRSNFWIENPPNVYLSNRSTPQNPSTVGAAASSLPIVPPTSNPVGVAARILQVGDDSCRNRAPHPSIGTASRGIQPAGSNEGIHAREVSEDSAGRKTSLSTGDALRIKRSAKSSAGQPPPQKRSNATARILGVHYIDSDVDVTSPKRVTVGDFIERANLAGWNTLKDGKWTDPDGTIALSEKQLTKIWEWQRILELRVPIPQAPKEGEGPTAVSMTTGPDGQPMKPGDPLQPIVLLDRPRARAIRQGFVGDCSFLSSLASLAEYESRLKVPVISSLLFPQAQSINAHGIVKVKPLTNPQGMYACRLHFNGIMRKVLVDDFVPVRKDGKVLSAHSAHRREMWVTLLEKAFIKLMGGSYFMHGSNPGADLYHLTGWIPETIPFRKDIHTGSPDFYSPVVTGGAESSELSQDPRWNQVWDQLYQGFIQGSCVACLGTSEVADAAPSGLDFPEGVSVSSGIVARHAYSILNLREVGEHRLLYVRNPWACVRWKGKFSPGDAAWSPDMETILGYDSKAAEASDNGSFWIEWRDVVTWFSHLYLCWNNLFFAYESTVHAQWGASVHLHNSLLIDDSHCVAFNPQFHIKVAPIITDVHGTPYDDSEPEIADVWVLLSRHIRDRKRDLFQKYIAVHVYAGTERMSCPAVPTQQGVYSNGECALMRLRIRRRKAFSEEMTPEEYTFWKDEGTRHKRNNQNLMPPPTVCDANSGGINPVLEEQDLVLVVSQYSQKAPFNFTLKLFSTSRVITTEIPPLLLPSQWTTLSHKSLWTVSTAGGCSNDIWSYFKNPHYRLAVPESCKAFIFLECPTEVSVNVRILRNLFSSARLLRTGKATSSGPYRAACCVLEAELETGFYTIIVSNFKPGDLAPFQLRVHLSLPPDQWATSSWSALASLPSMRQAGGTGAALTPFRSPALCGIDMIAQEVTRQKPPCVRASSQAAVDGALQWTRAVGRARPPRNGQLSPDWRPLIPQLGLWPLPSPYPDGAPVDCMKVVERQGGTASRLFSVFKLHTHSPITIISVRIDSSHIQPANSIPSISLLYAMNSAHPLIRAGVPDPLGHCGVRECNAARFSHPLPFPASIPLGLLKKSDLEGGLSDTGDVPSSAALQLYQRRQAACLSHVELYDSREIYGQYLLVIDAIELDANIGMDNVRQKQYSRHPAGGTFTISVVASSDIALETVTVG